MMNIPGTIPVRRFGVRVRGHLCTVAVSWGDWFRPRGLVRFPVNSLSNGGWGLYLQIRGRGVAFQWLRRAR